MALATQCPHCQTAFRVAADQLKLRGGIVRCGTCHKIFDGNAHLIDLDSPPKPAAAAAPSPEPVPVQTADVDATSDPVEILPTPVEPEPAPPAAPPEPAPAPIRNPDGPLPLLRPAAAVETVIDPQPLPTPRIAPPPKPRVLGKARPRVLHELPPPEPDPDEPEFVKRGRELERTGRKRQIAMAAGSAALGLVLLLQAATTFRNTLAARYPGLAPGLTSLCASLGCKLELPMQIDALSIETGELQTIGADTFSLTTLLRNQSALNQAWPHIELELTDAVDKPLVRRVFAPAEYLPAGQHPVAGFSARSEQPVKLYFQLKDVKASGYHIAVFYP